MFNIYVILLIYYNYHYYAELKMQIIQYVN